MTGQDGMDKTGSAGSRGILVPLAETETARQTLDHAVHEANGRPIHLVVALSSEDATPEGEEEATRSREFLERAVIWAEESAGETELDIHTAIIGREDYLFAPDDFAEAYGDYASDHGLDHIIVDPEYWVDSVGPMLATFERGLEARGFDVTEARVVRPARHERLAAAATPTKLVTLFLISFGFYLLLGDPLYWFDLVTGVAVAGIVALTLGHVTFGRPPTYPGSIYRTLRFAVYVPYLIWEIVKANIVIAMVILHPAMPIDPRLTRFDAKVGGGLPLLALANSITLTPGTLTVRANDQRLIVHTLLPAAREDLFDGRLERAVRFVFYGRRLAVIPTPRERGDTAVLQGEEES